MALLQTCTYARITHTLRLAYAAHQVRRLMTGVRTSPSGLLDDWRATPLLMNPRVIKSKGRPKKSKSKKTSTRRDPSAFEIEAKKAKERKGQVLHP